MLEPERHEIIIRLLRQDRFAALHDIQQLIPASETTIRRDLIKLEEEGFIRRVHGGAGLAESAVSDDETYGEVPFHYRKGIMIIS
jgi:DeoR family fructose operon transcriptional repressor